ncbi:ankyrin [Lepidopterella palustris CBS 459.81]|uniref:Ankyrin n=1 Tax=Lepidopterella palustris CBS 459.81 TaxID=1314670 RepID=A0A8E2ECN3_9PEZI|nr:ankyrin [Lepidopterella palustris CBS 459.81]
MAETFAIISAAVSITDVSIRVIRELYGFISALSAASAELRYLHGSLNSLEIQMRHIKCLFVTYTTDLFAVNRRTFDHVNEELKACKDDLHQLRKLLGSPEDRTASVINRFGVRVKTVFQEKKLGKVAERIERRKLSFATALSIIGRQIELEIQKGLKKIQDGQKIDRQQLSRNTEQVYMRFDSIDEAQRIVIKEQRQSSQKLEEYTAKLDGLQFSIAGEKGENSVVVIGSAEKAAASLYLVSSHLHKVFLAVQQQSNPPLLSHDDIDWLESEFKFLLAAVSKEASQELIRPRRSAGYPDKRRPTQPITIQKLFRVNEVNDEELPAAIPQRSEQAEREVVEIRETKVDFNLFIGKLTLFISERSLDQSFRQNGCSINGVRLSFFPRPEISLHGFAVSSTYDWRGRSCISPILSTFGVLASHEAIWDAIEDGNIVSVRRLLGERRIHPNDRNLDYGSSLLGWAAWNHQVEICNLLLREGADPLNCDADGYSALSVFYRGSAGNSRQGTQLVDGTRTLITVCGADVVESDKHLDWNGRVTGSFSHGIVHRAVLELFPAWMDADSISQSYHSLELLLQHGGDLGERNGWGRTPLLTAAFQVCLSALPRVITLLLKYGADPRVYDGDGEGLLHRLFSTLSGCNTASMGATWREEVVQLVVRLLRAGCDPNFSIKGGWTPSDNSLTPYSWAVWCESLTDAGLDVSKIIREDDDRDGLVWLENEIAEKYNSVVEESQYLVESCSRKPAQVDRSQNPCRICRNLCLWRRRPVPFDLLGSYLNSDRHYHQQLQNHAGGHLCLNYLSENSCTDLDHEDGYPPWPSAQELSWRKHVAYRLWREDALRHSSRATQH